MGIRSLIKFKERYPDGETKTLVTIYQQFDGHLEGVGKELAEFLSQKKIINGISSSLQYNDYYYANGPGCLAAQFISKFKTKVGGLYIISSENCEPQTYNYDVILDYQKHIKAPLSGVKIDDIAEVQVYKYDETDPIFAGSPSEFLEFIKIKF